MLRWGRSDDAPLAQHFNKGPVSVVAPINIERLERDGSLISHKPREASRAAADASPVRERLPNGRRYRWAVVVQIDGNEAAEAASQRDVYLWDT
jgi:hypothetical protein